MAILKYARTPVSLDVEEFELVAGELLAPQLVARWPGGPGHPFRVFHGSVSPGAEIDEARARELVVGPNDVVILQGYPSGPVLAILPIVTTVLSVASAFLFKPDEPEIATAQIEAQPEFERGQAGPNNRLGSKANEIRLGGRIPEIYGRVRVFPDVITEGYTEYLDNEQYLTEWFCVGIGVYDYDDPRVGESSLAQLVGTTLSSYPGGLVPPDVLEVRANDQARDITLVDASDAAESLTGTFGGNEIRSADPTLYYSVEPDYFLQIFNSTAQDGIYLVENRYIAGNLFVVVLLDVDFGLASSSSYSFTVGTPVDGVTREVEYAPGTARTEWSGTWNYVISNGNAGPGELRHRLTPSDELSIRNTDALGVDQSANLAAVQIGDVIEVAAERWTVTGFGTGTGQTTVLQVDPAEYLAEAQYAFTFVNETPSNVRNDAVRLIDFEPAPDPFLVALDDAIAIAIIDPDEDTATGIYSVSGAETSGPHPERGNAVYLDLPIYLGGGPADFSPRRRVEDTTLVAIQAQTAANWSSWYEIPLRTPREVWLDVEFPRGLYTEIAGSGRSAYTVVVEFEVRFLETPSKVIRRAYGFTESGPGPFRYTRKIAILEDGLGQADRVEVRARKQTDPPPDTSSQVWVTETRWTRAAGANPLPPMELGDVSTIVLKSRATLLAARISERRFNVIATRHLPPWDEVNGFGTPRPSRKMADAFVHRAMAQDGGRYMAEELDLAGLYAVQGKLDAFDDGEAGHFDYSFDAETSTDAELTIIADACRCRAYRIGGRLFVRRADPVDAPAALYNRRNKSPEREVRLMSFSQSTSPDGVEIEWKDGGDRDYTARTYVEPAGAVSPRRIKLAGAVNWRTVWRRARFEWERLRLARDRITVNVTDEGRLVAVGDVVANVDNIDLDEVDGEIVGWDLPTLTLELDREAFLAPGANYSITLRDGTGRVLDTISASTGAGGDRFVKLARAPNVPIEVGDDQIRNLYRIGRDGSEGATLYTVVSVVIGDPYVTLELESYDPAVFVDDYAPVPPQAET